MQLAEYLIENRMTYKEFADMAGLSVPSIWKIANLRAKPTLDTMVAIERASDGRVTAQDFAHAYGAGAPRAAE